MARSLRPLVKWRISIDVRQTLTHQRTKSDTMTAEIKAATDVTIPN
jgi:hypothetical protein